MAHSRTHDRRSNRQRDARATARVGTVPAGSAEKTGADRPSRARRVDVCDVRQSGGGGVPDLPQDVLCGGSVLVEAQPSDVRRSQLMNTINGKLVIGAPRSPERYRNADYVCCPCFLAPNHPNLYARALPDGGQAEGLRCYVCGELATVFQVVTVIGESR